MAEDAAPNNDTPEAPPSATWSMVAKIKVLGILGAIVMLECVVAYMMLPSGGDPELLRQRYADKAREGVEVLPEDAELDPLPASDQTELFIGQFAVTSFQPVTNTSLRIDFNLYGITAKGDSADLETILEEHTHRIRDQIIVTVRSADLEMLNDPMLRSLKRRIRDKINQIASKPLLRGVIVSDFSLMEQ